MSFSLGVLKYVVCLCKGCDDIPLLQHPKPLPTKSLNTSPLASEPLSSELLPSAPLPSEPLPSEPLPLTPLSSVVVCHGQVRRQSVKVPVVEVAKRTN